MESIHYTYRAFISYRHVERDRKWAKWLMSKLEAYRTPKALVLAGVPQRVGKLFRDDDEIPASSNLGTQLEDALRDSEYLIVICSPETPRSEWVRREILFFQQIGRSDRIIPLLVEGEPKDSFPPELLTVSKTRVTPEETIEVYTEPVEPLAGDVRPRTDEAHRTTQHRAFVRIAAAMLHCRYDDLENREQQRQRKRQRAIYGLVTGVAVALFVSSIYWWDYTRLKTYYFNTYTTVYGVPVGIGSVTKAAAEQMNAAYALTYQRGRLVSMVQQTGAQKAVALGTGYGIDPWLEGIAQWRYQYDQNGRIASSDLADDKNHVKLVEHYVFADTDHDATVEFESTDAHGNARAAGIATATRQFGIGSREVSTISDISRHQIHFDATGHIASRLYRTPYGQSAKDQLGSAGRHYEYDSGGRLTIIGFLAVVDDEPIRFTLKSGLREIHLGVSEGGRLIKVSLFGEDNRPMLGNDGFAIDALAYDAVGNETEENYFGIDGESVLSKDAGTARVTARYDARGNVVEQAYLGIDGKPVLTKNVGAARVTQGFDGRGNSTEFAYFGVDGRPTLSKGGYAKITLAHDTRGNETEVAYFGVDGLPTLSKGGVAKIAWAHDGRDDRTEEVHLGVDGKPILDKDGVAKVAWAHDARGNETEENYFGVDGKPTLGKDGLAKFTMVYDARGNNTEVAYFGVDGKPTLGKDGLAKFTMAYDARGNKTEEAAFGVDGKPTLGKDGYAKVSATYDTRGNWSEVAYFGVDGKPILDKDGAAKVTTTYDARGNNTEADAFGVDGKPTLVKDGFAKFTMAYDARGNNTEVAYFRVDGKPTLVKGGYAKFTTVYDARGSKVEQAYFGVDGKPTLCTDGFARIAWAHDARGNLTEVAYFGVDGRSSLNNSGYAKVIRTYDTQDRQMSWETYNEKGQLLIRFHE
jgi:hypothetical protein